MNQKHWSAAFVGIPFADLGRTREGVDCYGLACVVYWERLGIELPTYAGGYVSSLERSEVASIIGGEADGALWERVDAASDCDLLIFKAGGLERHIGLEVGVRGKMLHVAHRSSSCLTPMAREPDYILRWRGSRGRRIDFALADKIEVAMSQRGRA